MNNNERAISTNELFDCRYIDTKGMYIYTFGKVPCVTLLQQVDGEKSFEAFRQKHASLVWEIYSHRVHEVANKKADFDTTIVILSNNCLLEFDQYHCEILHTHDEVDFVQELVPLFHPLKQKRRRIPMEINLVIRNVLVIEDAENIIMDRKANANSSVSNLLNISDGLLADFLNVQIICTFNSPLTMIDSALMRKGRLIAKYEFGKLGVAKSQRLSDHLGFDAVITKPMTLAEIANQHEADQQIKQVEAIGFRRNYLEN